MTIRTRAYYAPDPFSYINYSVTLVKDKYYSILQWTAESRDVKEYDRLTEKQFEYLGECQAKMDKKLKELFADMEKNNENNIVFHNVINRF
jgi:hypothetical protein